jgi:hypothetical protein
MIRVRFAKAWRMYQPGEIAAFGEDIVTQLQAAGFASIVDDKAEAAAEKAAQKAAAKAKAAEEAAAQAAAEAEAKAAEEAAAQAAAEENGDKR